MTAPGNWSAPAVRAGLFGSSAGPRRLKAWLPDPGSGSAPTETSRAVPIFTFSVKREHFFARLPAPPGRGKRKTSIEYFPVESGKNRMDQEVGHVFRFHGRLSFGIAVAIRPNRDPREGGSAINSQLTRSCPGQPDRDVEWTCTKEGWLLSWNWTGENSLLFPATRVRFGLRGFIRSFADSSNDAAFSRGRFPSPSRMPCRAVFDSST